MQSIEKTVLSMCFCIIWWKLVNHAGFNWVGCHWRQVYLPAIYSWLAVFTSTSIFALLPNQHLHTLARTPGLHAHTVLLSVWSFHVSSFFHIALQGLIVWQSSSFVNSRERIHHAAIHFEKNNSTDMITDHHADTPAMDDNGTVTASANTFSLCKNSTIHGWYYSAVFWQKTLWGQAWPMPLCRVSWAQICGGKTRQVLYKDICLYLLVVGSWEESPLRRREKSGEKSSIW